MSGKFINGLINNNGLPASGDKFVSSILSEDPYTVVVTFLQPFDADKTPVAVASPAGAPGDSNAQQTLALQASNTSLTIATNGTDAVPIYFMCTDKGLGYY